MLNLLLASLALSTLAGVREDPQPESPLFERVVVTGASLSAGYGLRQDLEVSAEFGQVFLSALRARNAHVTSHASLSFFADPDSTAKSLLVDSLQEEPTLLVALDFLFWFAHGTSPSEETRVDRVKAGLALLKSVGCPLVIADLPDMKLSLNGVNPFGIEFMRPDMLPQPETLRTINAEIHAWANERDHVSVVPLARFMEQMVSDADVVLRGNEWKGSVTTLILQEDLLHPTLEGDLGLAVLTLDTLSQNIQGFCEDCVRWKTAEIRTDLMQATSEAREKIRERIRKREERRQKREQSKQHEDQQQFVQPPLGSH